MKNGGWKKIFPFIIGKMVVRLESSGPSCFNPLRSPVKGDIPDKIPTIQGVQQGGLLSAPPSQEPPPSHFPYDF